MKDNSVKSKIIEWLRFFCIVAVVLIHAHGQPLEGKDVISYQYGAYDTIRILFSEGLCRVAVPIFFLISGYLFFYNLEEWNKNIWIDKLKKRIKTLLVPYILWNLIAFCFPLLKLYLKFFLHGGDAPDIIAEYKLAGGLRAFWDSSQGGLPINYPLWFLRDLMIFVILAPVVYHYVKKTGIGGLIILYLAYVLNCWIKLPGFSAEGFFYFSLGAYFAIHHVDFTDFFKKHWIVAASIACPLVIAMVLTFGNQMLLWGYAKRLFTLYGTGATIGIVALLFQKQYIKVHPILSNSSFLVYAAHARIVLPYMISLSNRLIPITCQTALITKYFMAPCITVILLVGCYSLLNRWTPKLLAFLTGGR